MVISEKQLNRIISENIAKRLNEFIKEDEQIFRNHIKNLVRESLMSMGSMPYEEKNSETDKKSEKKDSDADSQKDNRESDMNNETEHEQEIRSQVEDYLKNPGIDKAQYFYRLMGVEPQPGKDTNDMKNARGEGEKKLNHEKNEAGYPYSFSSQEINRLQSIISSEQLSEAITKAMKKVLK